MRKDRPIRKERCIGDKHHPRLRVSVTGIIRNGQRRALLKNKIKDDDVNLMRRKEIRRGILGFRNRDLHVLPLQMPLPKPRQFRFTFYNKNFNFSFHRQHLFDLTINTGKVVGVKI